MTNEIPRRAEGAAAVTAPNTDQSSARTACGIPRVNSVPANGTRIEARRPADSFYTRVRGVVTGSSKGFVKVMADEVMSKWSAKWEKHPTACSMDVKLEDIVEMSTAAQPSAEVSAQPSAGAWRAAEAIHPEYSHDWWMTVADRNSALYFNLFEKACAERLRLAAIIDRETAAPTLLAACKAVLLAHEGEIAHGGQVYTDADQLRAAISAATKGAS